MGHVDELYAESASKTGNAQGWVRLPDIPTHGEYRPGGPPKMCRIGGRL